MTDDDTDDARLADRLSERTAALLRGAVELDRFDDPSEGIETALTEFFEERPELRVDAAIAAYATDEEMSVGAAAQVADVDRFTMRRRLVELDELETGPDSVEAARDDVRAAHGIVDRPETVEQEPTDGQNETNEKEGDDRGRL